jgi:hypothetical protein
MMQVGTKRAFFAVLAIGLPLAAVSTLAATPDPPFRAEIDAALRRMTVAMEAAPSGDVDHDFVSLMEAHHEAAIAMSMAELRHGGNERLRRLAEAIIIQQREGMAALRLAIGSPPPPGAPTLEPQDVPLCRALRPAPSSRPHGEP